MGAFSSEVKKKLGYYVYRLIDPRDGHTFYVGRGKGDRLFAHIRAEKGYDGEKFGDDEKLDTIREIGLANLEVTHVVHRHGMKKNAAKEVESALIDAIPGLKNKVRGAGAKRGCANVRQLEERYALPVMDPDPAHMLMFIKTKTETVNDKGSLYDAVRCCWPVNPNRANRADYVLAIIEGVCVGVFEHCKWTRTVENAKKSGFVGRPVSDHDVIKRYVRMTLPEEYIGDGIQASVMYWPKDYKEWKPKRSIVAPIVGDGL